MNEEKQEIDSTFMTRIKTHQAGKFFISVNLKTLPPRALMIVLLSPQHVCGTTLRTAERFRFECERHQRYSIE